MDHVLKLVYLVVLRAHPAADAGGRDDGTTAVIVPVRCDT
jgi:hypothetical protein